VSAAKENKLRILRSLAAFFGSSALGRDTAAEHRRVRSGGVHRADERGGHQPEGARARGASPPAEIRDLMSYADAYSPVADELEALAQFVRHSVTAARNTAGSEALMTTSLAHDWRKSPSTPTSSVRGRHAPRTRTRQETDARGSRAKSNGTSGKGNGEGGQGDGEGDGQVSKDRAGESGPDDAAALVMPRRLQ